MDKLISIIIPTYNMEKYLGRCLNSVLSHKWDEILEVIVVNDGSKDRSLQIALEYKEKYSSILKIIDKENGNYGSTINAALPVAQGKYVKILDADDWFDTKEFDNFIEQLKNVESDLVISDFTLNYVSGKKKRVHFPYENNRIYDFSIMQSYKLLRMFMTAVSYKRELLIENDYKQTEGILYTDQEWIFYPMFFVNRIVFIKANVYQYFIGREGQSVDINVQHKNISHDLTGIEKMLSDYFLLEKKMEIANSRKTYLCYRIVKRIDWLYKFYLLILPIEDFDVTIISELDKNFKMRNKEIYLLVEKTGLNKLIPYIWYWRKYKKRIPQWIVKFIIKSKILKRFIWV
jgi:glycosyltransferase involved in cell wall biosynthesis